VVQNLQCLNFTVFKVSMLFIQVHVILAVVTRTFDISLFDLLIPFIRTVREHPKFVPLLPFHSLFSLLNLFSSPIKSIFWADIYIPLHSWELFIRPPSSLGVLGWHNTQACNPQSYPSTCAPTVPPRSHHATDIAGSAQARGARCQYLRKAGFYVPSR